MKYMGSKSRIILNIAPIIQKYIDDNCIINYYEPFCGGCNVIDHIRVENKYAFDKQKYLIALYQNLDKVKELPDFISKEHYSEVRDSYNKKDNRFDDWYIGAIGFLSSYNGRFFDGGYAGIVKTKVGTVRNYYDEAKRNLEKQMELLKNIHFECKDFKDLKNISESLIYCDPPYKDTKQYGINRNFDSEEFWKWVREMSKSNIVLVSEYQAPSDFECIWSQDILRTIDNTKRVRTCEKLFKMKI